MAWNEMEKVIFKIRPTWSITGVSKKKKKKRWVKSTPSRENPTCQSTEEDKTWKSTGNLGRTGAGEVELSAMFKEFELHFSWG